MRTATGHAVFASTSPVESVQGKFMRQFEANIEIQVTPQAVFAFYANVPTWNLDVRPSSIAEVFVSSTDGKLKPSNSLLCGTA
jgi:hypothetical protein